MTKLCRPRLVFWDFDGVIKESTDIKAHAFVQLFRPFGDAVVARVREHHKENGGMSRFDKIPLYLQWSGQQSSTLTVEEYCSRFSQLVFQAVVDAPWVPGVEAFLRSNPYGQQFVLVSATPQAELEEIVGVLDLRTCFTEVFGAPVRKEDAIRMTLFARACEPHECLMIGDALADLDAARVNGVAFLLRRHDNNADLFSSYTGLSIEDFLAL